MTTTTTLTGNLTVGFRRGWSDWQKDLPALSRWAAANGFGCIDLGQDAPAAAATVHDAGLAVGSADLVEWGALMSPDPARRKEAVAKNREHIERCAAAGISRFFICVVPEDPARARRDNFKDWLASAADLAPALEKAGAAIAIEGWPARGALCCNPADLRVLFKEIESSALGLNYDPSHLIRMGIDPVRFLHEFAPRVRHVHAKDAEIDTQKLYDFGWEQPDTFGSPPAFGGTIWRYTLPGYGSFRWTEGLRILQQAGYRGYVCIELEDARFNGTQAGEQQGLILSRQFLAGA